MATEARLAGNKEIGVARIQPRTDDMHRFKHNQVQDIDTH
jgi:hypothetical protein